MPFILAFLTLVFFQSPQTFFDQSDRFFKTYVKAGKVDYKTLKNEPHLLDSLVSEIGKANLKDKPVLYRKAFYINAYNLLVIKGVAERYPVKSPIAVEGFFQTVKFRVAGESISLDELEFQRLFPLDRDLRLHFVLNCGATSCPTLYSEAIRPEEINSQLNYSTQMVMDRDDYVFVDAKTKKIRVSKIFEWYRDMFEAGGQSIRTFINQNRFVTLPSGYEIEFMEYDWTLNEVR